MNLKREHRICGTMIRLPAARLRCLTRSSKLSCMKISSSLRDESILRENTPRCITPGFKARLNQGYALQLPFTNPPEQKEKKTRKVLKPFGSLYKHGPRACRVLRSFEPA